MQRIERTIIYGNIDTIWHRHPCLLDVFERAFVFGHERAACLAAELFRRPSQHESPKGDGATGSNTGRSTFVLRQIQTFLEYSWAYSQGLGIPLFRRTRLSRSNPRDLLAVRSTHPVRRASPTASHNHLGAGTVLSRWSTIYKHTSLVSEPSWCDHRASQATQAPAAPLIRLSWTPAHCETAHTLIGNLRDPTATLRQHPARSRNGVH